MDTTVFKAAVWARLPNITDADDVARLDRSIEGMQGRGFTVCDAVELCWCIENVNPELDEDIALKRMARIEARVKARGA